MGITFAEFLLPSNLRVDNIVIRKEVQSNVSIVREEAAEAEPDPEIGVSLGFDVFFDGVGLWCAFILFVLLEHLIADKDLHLESGIISVYSHGDVGVGKVGVAEEERVE